MEKISNSPEETYALGKLLGGQSKPGQVYCLDGDLGVGKTIFTQGFAAGLGIDEPVNSPTFTIVQQYDSGRLPLYHFDVYRIGDVSEMDEIGYEDCFYGEGVCLIEWSQLIPEILPDEDVYKRQKRGAGSGIRGAQSGSRCRGLRYLPQDRNSHGDGVRKRSEL